MRDDGQARARAVDLTDFRPTERLHRLGVECRAFACHTVTTHGKPFCLEHLHLMPRVAAIMRIVARHGDTWHKRRAL